MGPQIRPRGRRPAARHRRNSPLLRRALLLTTQALCELCEHAPLQGDLIATGLPVALVQACAPGEGMRDRARRTAMHALLRLLRAPHQRARAQLLGIARGGASMASAAGGRAAVLMLRSLYRSAAADDHIRYAAAVALCFIASDGEEAGHLRTAHREARTF